MYGRACQIEAQTTAIKLGKEQHHHIPLHMQHLNTLAVHNGIDNGILYQLKFDSKKHSDTNFEPKTKIIIRKKETNMNLVQYLHAACFTPTTFTF